MLQMRHVSKRFGGGPAAVEALNDVSFTVQPGEMVAVLGPSGSGKSTLLALAGGLVQPDAGHVLVNGTAPGARLRRRDIGYVFQDFNLLPGLTAAENVALPLELDGTSGRTALLAAISALTEIGLRDQAGRYPGQLSGGERQRVAIARAMAGPRTMAGQRKLLLADEPSGAVDTVTGEQIMRQISKACRDGMAALLATHEVSCAAWADRVLFLRDGQLVDQTQDGPETLLTAAQVA